MLPPFTSYYEFRNIFPINSIDVINIIIKFCFPKCLDRDCKEISFNYHCCCLDHAYGYMNDTSSDKYM